jgi:6-phosphofructokinase 1
MQSVRTWDRDGGTHIGSSRTNPFAVKKEGIKVDRSDEVLKNIEKLGLDALIAIGGEDTLGVGNKLYSLGANVVGVPKTIDKDLSETDYTIGFDTALRNCTEQIERSRTPAGSHRWIQIVEVMGRHAGHLALWSGVAGGAYIILIPEHPFSYKKIYSLLDERLSIIERKRIHPKYAIIVVAEGASVEGGDLATLDKSKDAFGHVRLGGIGDEISHKIRKETEYDSRSVALGHPQRGGSPTPRDRIMSLLFGNAAVEACMRKRFGMMVSSKGEGETAKIHLVKIGDAVAKIQCVDIKRYYDTSRYNIRRQMLLDV